MKDCKIRKVRVPGDVPEILEVYRPYIENTVVSFELKVPSLAEFEERVRGIQHRFPYLVCTCGNRILGYAYASEHRTRAAYRWNAELSVYLKPEATNRRIGTALYGALIEILKLQRFQNLYGGITLPNPASEKLHERFGFTRIGVHKHTGFKFGRWNSVLWFEKTIGDHSQTPQYPCSIREIPPESIAEILQRSEKQIEPKEEF